MKISVITPVYNREDCIERCMKSVEESIKYILNNRGSNFDDLEVEQIVVDDGSKDNTPQIVRQYADNHSGICLVFYKNELRKQFNNLQNPNITILKVRNIEYSNCLTNYRSLMSDIIPYSDNLTNFFLDN